MCGRYFITTPVAALADLFGVTIPDGLSPSSLSPRYNIAPSQSVPIVRRRPKSPVDAPVPTTQSTNAPAAERELAMVRWGLIPPWARDPAMGNRLINARSETITDKPAFRDSFADRRCLVIADGFFEWQRHSHMKQPYLIRLNGQQSFAMAGLWSIWRDSTGKALQSCAILTTEANEVCRPVHDRMPVILRPMDYDFWLCADFAAVDVLRPFDATEMEAFPVSPRVNSPKNDDPGVLLPVPQQPSLF